MKEKTKRRIKCFPKWFGKEIVSGIISAAIAVPVTILIYFNAANGAFAELGLTKYQMKTADYMQLIHDYSTSIDLYKRLEKKGEKRSRGSSVYASMILGKLYSSDAVADYSLAWEHFIKAMESDDPAVLRECLRFVLEQETLRQERLSEGEKKKTDDLVEIISEGKDGKNQSNNLIIVTQLFNKLYRLDSKFEECISDVASLTEDDVRAIINRESTLSFASSYKWEYVSTRTSHDGSEEFIGDKEKLVLVDQWSELVSSYSADTVNVYKYYRYQKVYLDIVDVLIFDLLEDYVGKDSAKYLSDFGLYK